MHAMWDSQKGDIAANSNPSDMGWPTGNGGKGFWQLIWEGLRVLIRILDSPDRWGRPLADLCTS